MRGYMMLWIVMLIVDYCLVDTPEHLIGTNMRFQHCLAYRTLKKSEVFLFVQGREKEDA